MIKTKIKTNTMLETNPLLEEADKLKNDGKHLEAIRTCERVLISNLSCSEAYEEIGDNYLSLREYAKAEKALKQAIKVNPKSANAHYLLGFVHSCTGSFEDSVMLLEIADELYPNHPEILRCLGWSMYHNNQKTRGIVILERALNLVPRDPLILNDLGVCYLNEKEFSKASTIFKKTLTIDPGNEKAKECLNAVNFFKREYDRLNKKS